MLGVALLVVAVYTAVLWGPGLLLGRLAGMRGWTLAAAAPLLGYGVVGLAGPAFAVVGLRWSPGSAGLLLVVLAAVLFGLRLLAGRRVANRAAAAPVGPAGRRAVPGGWSPTSVARDAGTRTGPGGDDPGTGTEPDWSRPVHLRVAAALAVIAAWGLVVIWVGVRRLSAVPQDWDAVFHANGIRYIAETGDSSLVGMGTVNWFENGVEVFYPNAYHLLGALVLRLTGVDVPTVLNAHTALMPGMGALVIVALVHRFGGRAVLAVAAAACAVAATPFYDMLWRGPLLTFATGVVLMPLAAVLVTDLLDVDGWRSRIGPGLLFAVGLIGLISLNPAILFSAALFVLPALVQRWIERPARLRHEPVVIAVAGLVAALLAVPQLLGSLGSAGGEPVDWAADLSVWQAVRALATMAHDGPLTAEAVRARPELWLTAAAGFGLLRIRQLGRLRWIVAAGAVFGALFLLTALSDADWVNAMTRPWWNDRWRFIGLCVVPVAIVAGHGLAEVVRLLADRFAAEPRLDRRLRNRPSLLAAGLVGVLFLVLSNGLYAGQNVARMRLSAPDGPVVSELEVQAMRVLATVVPPGQRVLNDRGDGSAWMYAIAGVLPVAGHYNASRIGPDAMLLAGRFNQYPTDPEVRAAVARLGVQYVMVDRGYVREEYRRQDGFIGLERARWLDTVYRNPDAVIYRIRAETPDRP